VLTALFGIIGVAYLPGLALSLWVENRFGLWASWILPLLLSPVLSVGAALLLTVSGFPMERTPGWIVLLSVMGVALAPQPRREIEDWAVSMEMPGFLRHRSDRQQVIGLATLVLILLAATLWSADWVSRSGEAIFHLGVAREILSGSLPPQDPYLAGLPVGTFWTFHAYLAVLQGATRMGGGDLLVGGSLIAAFVVVFTSYRLLNLLALSHARALWGSVFLFFAMNGVFWLLIPLDLLAGEYETVFFLEAFLTSGPFVMGLVYLLLFLMASVATLGEPRPRWNLLAVIAGVGMLLFHSGVGLLAFAVTVVAIPLIWLRTGLHPFRDEGREVFGVVLAMALALLISAPYLGPFVRRSASSTMQYIGTDPERVLFMIGALVPGFLFGLGVLFSFLKSGNVRRVAWAVWALVLMVASVFVVFPGQKPLLPALVLAHLMVALAAGASVPTWWQRGGRWGRALLVILLVGFLVPVTAMGMTRYLITPAPEPLLEPEIAAAEWIREETTPNAVLVGVSPRFALVAQRRVLYARPSHAPTVGYAEEELLWRRSVSRTLLESGSPETPERTRLLQLAAPVYVLHRGSPAESPNRDTEYREVFRSGSLAMSLWVPSQVPAGLEPEG